MAGPSVVDEIKQKIDIVELVGSYVSLKRAGRYFKANCPFHQEKTPSFVVSPDIGRWHCFGACHEGGDIFNFMMKWENITFAEALRLLAERAGVKLDAHASMGYQDEDSDKRARIFALQDLAAKYYSYVLTGTDIGKQAREYLADREISIELAKTFQIGYAPESWTSLRDYLHKKGHREEDLALTGLMVTGDRGMYDRFRGRLMFPIKNTRGQVAGFSGRLIKETVTDKDGGKYINSPETIVYHKRESLYGFYHTRDAIRKANTAIVVEGEFDMLTPYAKGITNIVAIKGSAFTDDQLKILRRSCERLILALDNDQAGFEALRKSTLDAQRYGFELYVCAISEGKDPDEAARTDLSGLRQALKHPVPVYDYIIDTFFTKVDEQDPYSKKHFIDGALPFIDLIVNPVVRTHYIQKAAGLLKMSERDIQTLLRDVKRVVAPRTSAPSVSNNTTTVAKDRTLTLARSILAILIAQPPSDTAREQIFQLLSDEDFTIPAYREIFGRLRAVYAKRARFDQGKFASELSPQIRAVFDELYLYASTIEGGEGSFGVRLALEYKKAILTERIRSTAQSPEADEGQMTMLNHELVAVEKKLSML